MTLSPALKQRRHIVSLILRARVIIGEFRREQMIADPLPIEVQIRRCRAPSHRPPRVWLSLAA